MNKPLLICLYLLLANSLSAQIETNLYKNADKEKMKVWVDSVYNHMSVDEKIGQLFMPIVEPNNRYKQRIANYISQQKVGGLLFSKGSSINQAEITNYAQSISKTPLFIALDGEWGLSMRLSDAPQFPRNMSLGSITNDSIIYLYGKEIARQCKELGIHINFAPSIDVHSNPENPVIGTRAFGTDPSNVARKGIAYGRGLEDNGVMAVAKHFPGHGDTSEDSHKTLPTITHPLERLSEVELFPFKEYIGAGLSGLMTGHLNVPALDTKGMPSSLSPNVSRGLLKDSIGFTGLVFTDAMAMKGVSSHPNNSVKAILAGNDIILGVTNQAKEFESVSDAVRNGTISDKLLERKVKKILSYKYILGLNKPQRINEDSIRRNLNSKTTEWIQRKLYDEALTLVKNDSSFLPLTGLDRKSIAIVTIGSSPTTEFEVYMGKYDKVASFQIRLQEDIQIVENDLKDYNTAIFAFLPTALSETLELQKLICSKKSVIVFFDSPYSLIQHKLSVDSSLAVVIAQDGTPFAQMSAAQGIFGGIPMKGKLQVNAGKYLMNFGISTNKTRLSYNLPEEVNISSDKLKGIEIIAREGIRNKAYPGSHIMVVKDGVVIYEESFGNFEYGTGSKVTDQTVYDLASVTKASATLPAVMKLYDEKKIKLQDHLSKFVPETKKSNKANISVRELLLHESGIVSYIPYYMSAINKESYTGTLFGKQSSLFNAYYAGAWGRTDYKFLPDLISTKPSDTFYLPVAENLFASKKMHDVLLKDVIDTELSRRGKYRYSCLNFMLLKEMVENVSKKDLNTFVQDNFFKKLGASSTTFQPTKYMDVNIIAPTEHDPFFRKQTVRGYVHDEGAALFGGISGNAGLFSNANDLAKLYQMILNGGEYGGERYLDEETVRLFTLTKSGISRRGLGFDKPDPLNNNASPTSPQTPIEVYGHTGFTGTSFWIDPTNNMIYIFLSNRVFPTRSPNKLSSLSIRERIQEEIYNAINNSKAE